MSELRDIQTDNEAVTSPAVRRADLMLAGVKLGDAATQVPAQLVREVTLAPIIHSSRSGTRIAPRYWDVNGQELSLECVIRNAIAERGTLHLGGASISVHDGVVVGFALYGNGLAQRFSHILNHNHFLGVFGRGDRSEEDVSHGDMMGYRHYYHSPQKYAYWSTFSNELTTVNWRDRADDYDGRRRAG